MVPRAPLAAVVLLLHLSSFAALNSAAQPLTIDQLVVDEERWQLQASAGFASQTSLPGLRRESWQLNTGMRFGLTPRVGLRVGARNNGGRVIAGDATTSEGGSSILLGASWQILGEAALPAVLFEYERAVSLNASIGDAPYQRAALTAYKTLDPIVLSATLSLVGAEQRLETMAVTQKLRAVSIDTTANFAVNPWVTLIAGLSIRESRHRGREEPFGGPRFLSLRGGLATALGSRDSVFIEGASGSDGAVSLQVSWLRRF